MAEWLNTSFAGLDGAVFNFTHNLAVKASGFFTPLSLILAFLGKGGIAFLVLGVVLLLFSFSEPTRIILSLKKKRI